MTWPCWRRRSRRHGREAVREWYAHYTYFRAGLTHLRHKISNIQIDLDGDEARVVSYMDADLIAERVIVVYHADERLAELLSADS